MSPEFNGFFRANPIAKSAQAVSWRGIKMPIDILLGLPGYVTNQAGFPSIAFNLTGALSILLHNHAEVASKMLVPHVWAPGLDNAALAAFAESAVNGRLEPFIYDTKGLRVAQFPGQAKQPIRRKDYEIIHFCGKVSPQGELLLDEQGTNLSLESLSSALRASRTRLLIFDAIDRQSFDNAASLASLAESLGLAVLRVHARSSAAHDEYLMDVYANLVHNRQLVEMTTPGYWYENELQIELTYPKGGEDILNFNRWMAALEKRLVRAESRVERISKMEEKIQSYSPVLHTTQSKRLFSENIREAIDNSTDRLRESLDTLRSIRHTTWDHERDGAVFLPAMAEAARMVDRTTLEAALSLPQAGAIEEEIRNAPRVINTNFAEDSGRVIPLEESLQAGATYDLLVDIGPRWNRFPSLLGENAEFPEEAIGELVSEEEKQQGWFDVEVVFVSEQFSPNLVSARMRVPLLAIGRSIPYKGQSQELADRPGPVHLRVSAPQTAHKKETLRAHGRLCLYYGAQVIQSAVLDIGVQRQAGQVQETLNSGLVDYVLTPGFRAVEETIATRRLSENGEAVPVKVGLMLNDDLSGSHRLLLKMHDTQETETASLPPAWKSYDAAMIQSVLERARSILVNPAGQNLASYNSETFLLDKFKDDLTALGKLGAELYSILLQGITPGGSLSPLAWRKKFRSALQPGDVIQLARTGSVPSTHIIPWALVYEIPIEPGHSEKPFKICRVVDEQWDKVTATRKQAQGFAACPYEHEHETNVICPFGFWGYKYTLEQPLSALHSKGWDIEPARRTLADIPIKMAVAATEDVPRKSRYQTHFETIRQAVSAEYLPSGLARERDEFRDSLRAPQIVYILCHGGKDGKVTTLSIGPRDKDAKHTITPDLPGNWGEHDYIDLEKWEETRPLVFINGCYTTDLLPELTLDFVSAFRDLMVGGVIGTEIEVTVEFGYQAAERFFEHLGRGAGVGQAILSMRWDLLNQGSFIGLAYTPYAMSDMHLERNSSVTPSPATPAVAISNDH
ncbi:MAG: hypothetical protein CVU44_19440 [Chloroflexi bacterium HGW-Chloroflexi-6]|nr:MAG: hypothetical protein CVU44_19440 [Chloroflexi bacterium HGW-Chloroflexi-6]